LGAGEEHGAEVAGDDVTGGVGEIEGLAVHDLDVDVGEAFADGALAQAFDHER
jgi:hypothetical protein